jgi:hypothetical protein
MKKSLYIMQQCGRCKETERQKWLTPLEAFNYAVRGAIEPYLCDLCKTEIMARYQKAIDRRVASIIRKNKIIRSYFTDE